MNDKEREIMNETQEAMEEETHRQAMCDPNGKGCKYCDEEQLVEDKAHNEIGLGAIARKQKHCNVG